MTHRHWWYAAFLSLGFLGSVCSACKAKTFLAGYSDPRKNAIVERLNRSWRVR